MDELDYTISFFDSLDQFPFNEPQHCMDFLNDVEPPTQFYQQEHYLSFPSYEEISVQSPEPQPMLNYPIQQLAPNPPIEKPVEKQVQQCVIVSRVTDGLSQREKPYNEWSSKSRKRGSKKWTSLKEECETIIRKVKSLDFVFRKGFVGECSTLEELVRAIKKSDELFTRRQDLWKIVDASNPCLDKRKILALLFEIRNLDEGSITGKAIASVKMGPRIDPNRNREIVKQLQEEKAKELQARENDAPKFVRAFGLSCMEMAFKSDFEQPQVESDPISLLEQLELNDPLNGF